LTDLEVGLVIKVCQVIRAWQWGYKKIKARKNKNPKMKGR